MQAMQIPTLSDAYVFFVMIDCAVGESILAVQYVIVHFTLAREFKGTLSRDFRPPVFFIKQLHLGPWPTG
jgi:hypothetical protein